MARTWWKKPKMIQLLACAERLILFYCFASHTFTLAFATKISLNLILLLFLWMNVCSASFCQRFSFIVVLLPFYLPISRVLRAGATCSIAQRWKVVFIFSTKKLKLIKIYHFPALLSHFRYVSEKLDKSCGLCCFGTFHRGLLCC